MNTLPNQILAIVYSAILALVLGILTYAFINGCAPFVAWALTILIYAFIFIISLITLGCYVGIFALGELMLELGELQDMVCKDFFGTLMLTKEPYGLIYENAYGICHFLRAEDLRIALTISAISFICAFMVFRECSSSDESPTILEQKMN